MGFTKKRGTVGWPNKQARQIESAATAMGLNVDLHHAQTGTIYLTLDENLKIRVADHGECYCSEAISCDPTGYSVDQAIDWIAERFERAVPTAILRVRKAVATRAANRQTAKQADIIDRRNRVLAMLADNPDVAIDARGMVSGIVAAGEPNRKNRIRAANEAISEAYKIANK